MATSPEMTQSMIATENLRKAYGRTRALDGLSMHVDKGAIYGFVGPNGAGKTTTMRVLATLLRPDTGTARVGDMDVVTHAGAVRPILGFMPDFFGVYDDLTVWEYMDFYGASYGIPAAQRRRTADDLLELVDLTAKRNAYVETLSRGMKQRLGLARCLVHNPQVLLLDEPASGMDPRARVEMREIIRELQRMGKTVLVSSHILLELAEMCTHIGVVLNGKIIREGSVSEVLRGLSGGRTVRVSLLNPGVMDRAVEVMAGQAIVQATRPDEATATLEIDVTGDDAGLSRVLRALIDADLSIVSFAPTTNNLEEIFMQLTEVHDEAATAAAGNKDGVRA